LAFLSASQLQSDAKHARVICRVAHTLLLRTVRSTMYIPTLEGTIDRRLLVNYRVDPDSLQRLLPGPFRPKLIHGMGIAGICLIRLKQLRPEALPARSVSLRRMQLTASRWSGKRTAHIEKASIFPGETPLHSSTSSLAEGCFPASIIMRAFR